MAGWRQIRIEVNSMVPSIQLQILTPSLTSYITFDKILDPQLPHLNMWCLLHQTCRGLNETMPEETWHSAQHRVNPLWREGITTKMNTCQTQRMVSVASTSGHNYKGWLKKMLCNQNYINTKGIFFITNRNNGLNKWLLREEVQTPRGLLPTDLCVCTQMLRKGTGLV